MVHTFTFNPFSENTFVLYDESGDCMIVDPGCYTTVEREELRSFIEQERLRPVRLVNTHCHLDHVFGNRWVSETWGLSLEIHRGELPLLQRLVDTARIYGVPGVEASPLPSRYIEPGEEICFGNTRLRVLFTPGHSPASICFYNELEEYVIAGDVLFLEGIGRTDLPGGDFDTLISSIRQQLFVLPETTLVYPGHGPATTIRHEMEFNPFL